MALYPDYVTAAQLKTSVGIPTSDTADDALLAIVITAASRAVDAHTNRQFGNTGVTSQTRRLTWDGRRLEDRAALQIPDLQTTTDLAVTLVDVDDVVEATLVNGTDFDLWPWDATFRSEPWTHIVLRTDANTGLSRRSRAVSFVGRWGWTAVPKLVENATLLQAARWFKRKDAPFGVAETPSGGEGFRLLDRLDADVALSLQSLRRVWGAV